jgi:predicted dithiol-disulfide oxidoreductase (DUF899 family)
MTPHKVGTQEEWQAARDELLAEEKELTRRNDELARKRRELPWVPVATDYSFATDDGTKSLAELFDGRSQLLIYHFMFGPAYEAGCPVCSSIADNLDPNAIHLAARDVKLMLVSRAALEKLQGYKKRMSWSLDWASTVGSEFNRELGFLHTEEELKPFLEGEVRSARVCERKFVGQDPRPRGRASAQSTALAEQAATPAKCVNRRPMRSGPGRIFGAGCPSPTSTCTPSTRSSTARAASTRWPSAPRPTTSRRSGSPTTG